MIERATTITLRLRPELASALRAAASRAGRPLTTIAHRLIATQLGLPPEIADPRPKARPRKSSAQGA